MRRASQSLRTPPVSCTDNCGDISGFVPTLLSDYTALDVDADVDTAARLIRNSLGNITVRVMGERCEPDVVASFGNVMRAEPFSQLLSGNSVVIRESKIALKGPYSSATSDWWASWTETSIALAVAEIKGSFSSVHGAFAQAATSACNSVAVLHAWGLPRKQCLVPIMATHGPDEKHGVVYVLNNGLPCVATLAPLLSLLTDAGRREAAMWRLRLCLHVARLAQQLENLKSHDEEWRMAFTGKMQQVVGLKEQDFVLLDDQFFCKEPERLHYSLEEASLAAQLRVFECLRTHAPQVAVLPETVLSFSTEQGTKKLLVPDKAKLVFANMVKEGFVVGLPAPKNVPSWLRKLHEAVGLMHNAGVVHLDLHPNNTMFRLANDGSGVERIVILDFDSALLFKEDIINEDIIQHVHRGAWRDAYPTVLANGSANLYKADWYFVAAVLVAHLDKRTEGWVKGADGADARAVSLEDLRLYLEEKRDKLIKCVDAVRDSLEDGVDACKAEGLVEDDCVFEST